MATLTYPTTEPFRPESMLWRLEDSVAISTSSLNGVTRTKELPGARWVVELSYDQQDDIERATVEGWWARAGQRKNDLLLWHYKRPQARGTIGATAGTAALTTVQGATSMQIAFGGAHAGKTMLAGDLFGAGGRVRMMTEDATANGAGVLISVFEPPLEATVTAGAAITLLRPTSKFINTAAGVAVPYKGNRGGPGFTVTLAEIY